jgi:3-dehydroquinate dehydratase-2
VKILVIHGPNLNLLGIREPEIYGTLTLEALDHRIRTHAEKLGIEVQGFQSNHEGAIIDALHGAMGVFDGVIINPAGYTHTSVAILDALKAIGLPAIEVHLSNPKDREAFRKQSITGAGCLEAIAGLGPDSYLKALNRLSEHHKGGTGAP